MPFLLSMATGLPLEGPTYWALADRRAKNVAANTIRNDLHDLIYLYLFCDLRGIDLLERLEEGVFFTQAEIVDLARLAGRYYSDLVQEIESNVINLGAVKRRVAPTVRRHRLATAHAYIEFAARDIRDKLNAWPQRWAQYNDAKAECLKLLESHVTAAGKGARSGIGDREGLDPAIVARVLEVVDPDHPENPWSPEARFRNFVILRLFLELGVRRGELAGIKTPDLILGATGTVTVHRRPDDPEDTRREKATTKTLARPLPLGRRLTELLHEWIVHHRAKIPGASRHPYLIVSTQGGGPLSLSGFNKVFDKLREKVPGLPSEITPHVMRHTWNDKFSDLMDAKGVDADQEMKMRMRLMGWRREESAAHYLNRTVRRRADAAQREMQDKMDIRVDRDDE